MYSEALKAHMKSSGRKVVWLNDSGEWMNHAHPRYPNKVSAEEIEADTDGSASSGGKKKNTIELIANINASATKEEAIDAAEGDKRATVVKALDDKLATFTD